MSRNQANNYMQSPLIYILLILAMGCAQKNVTKPAMVSNEIAADSNEYKISVNESQASYLWKIDTIGCLGFRKKLHVGYNIGHMNRDAILQFLGNPNIESVDDNVYHYIYFVSSDYCKYCSNNCVYSTNNYLEYPSLILEMEIAGDTISKIYMSIVN